MNEAKHRFVVPAILSAIGICLTFLLANTLAGFIIRAYPGADLVPAITRETLAGDVWTVLVVVFPVIFIEYLVLALPLAAIFMALHKVFKASAYEQSVMKLGDRFGADRILRRAAVPALFAISTGQMSIYLLGDYFLVPPASLAGEVGLAITPLLAIIGAAIALPVSLAFFMPTWLLNDSGIVLHLKKGQLKVRRCPDTEGVGRWFSNFLGGFSVIALPLSSIVHFFVQPYFVDGRALTPLNAITSVFWIIGLPILMMAFVVPVVILNELMLGFTTPRVQNIARHLGAKDVQMAPAEKKLYSEIEMSDAQENYSDSMGPDQK
jgi:hypothetical protein